ncbi:MAG: hypothetical protein WDN67_04270 [Candidatus Moraniibacteriota bacterium]
MFLFPVAWLIGILVWRKAKGELSLWKTFAILTLFFIVSYPWIALGVMFGSSNSQVEIIAADSFLYVLLAIFVLSAAASKFGKKGLVPMLLFGGSGLWFLAMIVASYVIEGRVIFFTTR